jgi:hypothetical protein
VQQEAERRAFEEAARWHDERADAWRKAAEFTDAVMDGLTPDMVRFAAKRIGYGRCKAHEESAEWLLARARSSAAAQPEAK